MKMMMTPVMVLVVAVMASACSQEQQNKLSRMGVSWLEGNYQVTFVEGSHKKTWTVLDGKVTSEPAKGYYYFWAVEEGRKFYVQTPIVRSYIEEIRQ